MQAREKKVTILLWLGSEPHRSFFLTGILFSIAGVLLWSLPYQGMPT